MNYATSDDSPNWHTLAPNLVAERLGSDLTTGLRETEAAERLSEQGPNRLAEKPLTRRWQLFFDQFRGALILMLIGAAILARVIGDIKDAVVS